MKKELEFKVGLFVAICMGLVVAMSFQVNNDPSVTGRAKHYDALLSNASGLVKNSNVKSAGIPVGIIREITLDNGKAKVRMNIRGDLPVTKSSRIEIKQDLQSSYVP